MFLHPQLHVVMVLKSVSLPVLHQGCFPIVQSDLGDHNRLYESTTFGTRVAGESRIVPEIEGEGNGGAFSVIGEETSPTSE